MTAEGLVGEQITVSGEVERVVSPQAFLIGGELLSFGLEEGTLVFGADIPDVTEEGFVQVTGTVREFVVADIQNELGIDFGDDEFFLEYEDEFALVADTVESVPQS